LPLMHDIPNFSLTIVSAERPMVSSVIDALENLTESIILKDSDLFSAHFRSSDQNRPYSCVRC